MAPSSARVFQLNVSPGGVPKRAVASAHVGPLGLDGDSVAHPKIHGGPDRAVCLYALERLIALQQEGHPVFPGALGENLTLVGIHWDKVVPGARLRIGDALLEVTKYAQPCGTTSVFTNGDKACFDQEKRPGWSRVYARVLAEGTLRPGMPVSL
jgi:MOSC domain-containing protein YiiM